MGHLSIFEEMINSHNEKKIEEDEDFIKNQKTI